MAILKLLKEEEVGNIAKNIYQDYKKQTGSVPEWVKVMAHQPEILKEFTELFNIIMKQGEVKTLLKWKIAYVVSETLKCTFCVSVTIQMLKKLGISDYHLANVKKINYLPKEEQQILDLVRDITQNGQLNKPEVFVKLKNKLSAAQIVEIVSVIGLFNYINRFNNAFAILPL